MEIQKPKQMSIIITRTKFFLLFFLFFGNVCAKCSYVDSICSSFIISKLENYNQMLKMNLSNDANTFIEFRFVKRTNNGRFLFVKANFYNTNYCVDLFVDSFSNDVNLIKMGTCSYEKYNSKIVHKILKKHRSYFGHLKDEEYFDQVIDFITPGVLCVAKTNDREPPRVSNCGDSLQFILNAVNSRSNNKKCNFIFFNPLRRRNNILPIRAKRKKKYDFYFVGALRHHKKFKKNFYAIIDDLDVIRGLFPIWKSV